MKYLLLAYGSQQEYDSLTGKEGARPLVPADELAAIGDFLTKFTGELAESGELVDVHGLAAPALAREVHLRDGVPVVTDGPFAETEEVLGGYWLVDCVSLDRATEIAAKLAGGPGPRPEIGIIIRPVDEPGEEPTP